MLWDVWIDIYFTINMSNGELRRDMHRTGNPRASIERYKRASNYYWLFKTEFSTCSATGYSPLRHKTELVPHSNMSRILFSFFLALHEAFEVAYTCVTTKIESTVQGRINWSLTRHHHITLHTHLHIDTHNLRVLMLCGHAHIIRRADGSWWWWALLAK